MAHYLDHAATTPILPVSLEAWTRAQRDLMDQPGNPAALHSGGRRARLMLEDARERVAAALGAQRAEVVFTSGATESNALTIAGGARAIRSLDASRKRVLLSGIEHDSVAEQSSTLAREGFSIDTLPVGSDGVVVIDTERLAQMSDVLALASCVLVSSEVGTVQPVERLVSALGSGGQRPPERPLVHTDAAQGIGLLDVSFADLGVDLMSVGGHKVGAPVGTGVICAKRGIPLETDRPGGGHERGLRSGTPDAAGACALAAALEAAVAGRDQWRRRASALRTRLAQGLPPSARLTVDQSASVASIIHVSIPTRHPETVLMAMDAADVLVSVGSACHAGVTRPSKALLAMGASEEQALGVLRVSTGPDTTDEDVDAFLEALPRAIEAGCALDALDDTRART